MSLKPRKPPRVLCVAHRSDGKPCGRPPAIGAAVCHSHGAAAKQVRAKAQMRLLLSADQLMAALMDVALDESVPVAVRLQAIRDGLDRAQLGAKQELEVKVELTQWEQNAAKVTGVVEEYVALPAGYDDEGNTMTPEEQRDLESMKATRQRETGEETAPLPLALAPRKLANQEEINKRIGDEMLRRIAGPLKPTRIAKRRSQLE